MDRSHQHQELKELFLTLKNIDRRITQCFEKRAGISLTRYELLYMLLTRGKLSQTALQQQLNIDQAAITRHLKLLEEQKLVFRQRNELNNREVIVEITESGKDQLSSCDGERSQFLNELYKGFTAEEVEQLQALILKLNNNVEHL